MILNQITATHISEQIKHNWPIFEIYPNNYFGATKRPTIVQRLLKENAFHVASFFKYLVYYKQIFKKNIYADVRC